MESREFTVGTRIARICYAMYQDGSSKKSFEKEILKAKLNGADVGDINHSNIVKQLCEMFDLCS